MKRLVLAALAATGLASAAHPQSAPAAESWLYAGMSGGAMGWDASAIRRDADAGTASTMRFLYYLRPLRGEKRDFTWVFQDIEFDCRANAFRLMEGALYDRGRANRVDQPAGEDFHPVRANTPESALKQILCDKATLDGTQMAASMADAMDGAEKAALP
jgi:hypothetical protein